MIYRRSFGLIPGGHTIDGISCVVRRGSSIVWFKVVGGPRPISVVDVVHRIFIAQHRPLGHHAGNLEDKETGLSCSVQLHVEENDRDLVDARDRWVVGEIYCADNLPLQVLENPSPCLFAIPFRHELEIRFLRDFETLSHHDYGSSRHHQLSEIETSDDHHASCPPHAIDSALLV